MPSCFSFQERNLITVEGLNTTFKVMGKSKDFPGMGVLEEQPLRVTDQVQLVDPVDEKVTEVEWRHAYSAAIGRIVNLQKSVDKGFKELDVVKDLATTLKLLWSEPRNVDSKNMFLDRWIRKVYDALKIVLLITLG